MTIKVKVENIMIPQFNTVKKPATLL